jgi:ribonuclease HI
MHPYHLPMTIIHIDGGSRGNPGLAAFAGIIAVPGHAAIEFAETIPHATNNVAEYTALVEALHRASEMGLREVEIRSDSELLVKQMNGEYRVKHPDLQPLYTEATDLRRTFDRVTVVHIRREQNKRADQLCNEAMDRVSKPASPPVGQSPSLPKEPRKPVSDVRVRADALACLDGAAKAWAANGPGRPPVEMVWEQLWSLLEENQVLKVPKKK